MIIDHKIKKRIGALGEELVLKHLVRKGFVHLQSNFLRRQGEIDLIMEFDKKIHFIEVKTVSREILIEKKNDVARETEKHNPEENVSLWKMRKLARVVKIYLSENHLWDREWQFNVVVVYLDQKNKKAYIKTIRDIPLSE